MRQFDTPSLALGHGQMRMTAAILDANEQDRLIARLTRAGVEDPYVPHRANRRRSEWDRRRGDGTTPRIDAPVSQPRLDSFPDHLLPPWRQSLFSLAGNDSTAQAALTPLESVGGWH